MKESNLTFSYIGSFVSTELLREVVVGEEGNEFFRNYFSILLTTSLFGTKLKKKSNRLSYLGINIFSSVNPYSTFPKDSDIVSISLTYIISLVFTILR